MTRHEIQILRAVGMAQTAVAAKTGASVQSVRRIEREELVTTSHTEVLTAACGVGRPSLAAPWGAQLATWLAEERGLPGVELLRRAREVGYPGGKSALHELIRRLRALALAPLVRFEGVPGEFSQHDFGQVDVRYTSGIVERVHFFASRLKCNSCGKYVVLSHRQASTTEDLGFGAVTRYCHLSVQTAVEGTHVRRGDVIGNIGTTGWSRPQTTTTGYEHVHWELISDGAKIDPLPFTVGCFDPWQSYPTDRLVLTYPVQCKN